MKNSEEWNKEGRADLTEKGATNICTFSFSLSPYI